MPQIVSAPVFDSQITSARPLPLTSPVPATCHSDPIWALTRPTPARLVPFIDHTVAWLVVLIQKMSASPSPLKSPVPATCHAAPIWPLGMPDCDRLAPLSSHTLT